MRQFSILLLLLLLSACGFHLQGSAAIPPELLEMAVVDAQPATTIAPDLRSALRRKGVLVSDLAPLSLQLRGESFSKRVLSVDASGRALEYGLGYTVSFSLQGKAGLSWIPVESVVVTRDLRFEAAEVLATANEETVLVTEMRNEAVMRILRRLQYVKKPVSEPVKKPQHPLEN
jgi:LPS-assembly lipoprotein